MKPTLSIVTSTNVRAVVAAILASAMSVPLTAQQPREEAAPGSGERPAMGVSVGFGQTDNLYRSNVDPLRSDIRTLGLTLGAGTNTRRLDGRIATDLQYRKYGADDLLDDDEIVGSLDGALDVQLVPELLVWNFEQNFGQTRTDPFTPVGPNNRQKTRVFSTGPQLTAPIGQRNALQAGANVSERSFEDSYFIDSTLTTLNIGFAHEVDTATRLLVSVDDRKNELSNNAGTYEFRILSVTYSRELASGSVLTSVGRGEVDIDNRVDSTAVARLEWSHGIGARSAVNVWARRELTDAGEIFRFGGFQGATGSALTGFESALNINDSRLRGIVLTSEPLQRSGAGVRLGLVGTAVRVDLAASISQDDFQTDTFDNDYDVLEFAVSRGFGPFWTASLDLASTRQHFTVLTDDYDERRTRVGASRRLGRTMYLEVSLEKNQRDGDFWRYDERAYGISLARRTSDQFSRANSVRPRIAE